MRSSILALGALAIGLNGCADPQVAARIDKLEARVAALEEGAQNAPAERGKAGKAKANSADEQAAAALLKEASEAAEKMKYKVAKKKLDTLQAEYGATRAARAAQRLKSELDIIGKPAPDMKVEKWFNNESTFADGKATFVVFWEVWCPHCKREVPKIEGTHAKWKDKGLNVVGLTKMTRNITEDQVKSFVKDNKITYAIGKEDGDSMSREFGVRGIPAAAVVKDGKIVWRGHPARVTDEMIKGWLNS